MNDMTKVIVPKSDQLNADDLIGGPLTITITEVDIRPGTEQPVAVSFEGDGGRPWKPCKSMCRVLVAAWGPDAKVYVGRRVTLYRDPSVKWGGMDVGGIRVSHLSHMQRDMVLALTATKGKRAHFQVGVLPETAPAKDAAREVADVILAKIAECHDEQALQALTADAKVMKNRAALREKRPELADEVDAAVAAQLARLADDFPGDRP